MTEEVISNLWAAAKEASKNSYSPYSKFPVGAALLCRDGRIIPGTNVENASYPLGNCGERTAMFTAIAQGYRPGDFEAICTYAPTPDIASPCGACRQVMSELLGPDVPVILTNDKETVVYTVRDLLPFAFEL